MANLREKVTGPKDDTVADLNKLLAQSRGAQSRFISIWELNRAYYHGDQWVFWNRTRIDRPRLDNSRVLIVDNRIQGIVRTEIAKMSKQHPTFQVVPTSPEASDIQASETGEKILDFLWRHLKLRIKLEDALLWSRVCGAGFWKVCWDSSAGDKVQVVIDEEGNPVQHAETKAPVLPHELHDESGNLPSHVTAKTIATGDVHVETVSPFEIFPDPIAKTLNECEWLIQTTIKSQEYVKAHYDVDMEADANISPGPSEIRIPMTSESGSEYKGIKVNEYWSNPNTKYPKGRRVVWAKNKILEQGDNPYECIPFVMFRSVPAPGRFWPTSVTEQLRGPQTELNKIKSQIVENAQRIGNPSMLKSRQSNVQMSGVPGEVIEYDDTTQNSMPSFLKPPDMPAYVIEQIGRIESSMQEISGQHEVSNAQVPPGVKAASAINLLQEADDTRLGPGIYDMEEALAQAGEMLLKLVAQYWTEERTVVVAGENHRVDAQVFKGAALKENTHVEVQTGSAMPKSKAAKQAAIQDMLSLYFQYQGQQPLNKRMLAKVLKDLEAGGLEKLFGDVGVDESQINGENQEMAQGEPVTLHAYDNHQLHIEGHTEYQRSASYKALPPEAQKLIEMHVAAHRQQLLQMTGAAPRPQSSPAESLNYKDAPPDIKRQIESQAGLEPSKEPEPEEHKEVTETAPPEPAQPPGGSSGQS